MEYGSERLINYTYKGSLRTMLVKQVGIGEASICFYTIRTRAGLRDLQKYNGRWNVISPLKMGDELLQAVGRAIEAGFNNAPGLQCEVCIGGIKRVADLVSISGTGGDTYFVMISNDYHGRIWNTQHFGWKHDLGDVFTNADILAMIQIINQSKNK